MLTLEMLYAVIKGLPATHLDHLSRQWLLFCGDIHRAMQAGATPVDALIDTIRSLQYWQIKKMHSDFTVAQAVHTIPGLSYRQKQALIALRTAETASLPQLCRVLAQDRSNVHKRLNALVKKGLALKFFRPDGVYYFALTTQLQPDTRRAINRTMQSFAATLLTAPKLSIDMLAKFGKATTPTTATTSTTTTTPAQADQG